MGGKLVRSIRTWPNWLPEEAKRRRLGGPKKGLPGQDLSWQLGWPKALALAAPKGRRFLTDLPKWLK